MRYREAYVYFYDGVIKDDNHFLYVEFTDVENLIDQIDFYSHKNDLIEMDIIVRCTTLDETEIAELARLYIRVLDFNEPGVEVDKIRRLQEYLIVEMEKITQDMINDPHHLGRYRAYKEILDRINS